MKRDDVCVIGLEAGPGIDRSVEDKISEPNRCKVQHSVFCEND